MLEKLARQTAIYGISTIAVRFLSYLLTPYYTREFGQEAYGIVTDVYALIPLALTLLTMGMESSYFRFSARGRGGGRRRGGPNGGSSPRPGRHVARGAAFRRGDDPFPRRRRPSDGRSLCRAPRIRRLGRPHHPVRRLGLHSLFAASRAGARAHLRRNQGAERGAQRRAGRRLRRRGTLLHRLRRGVGLRRQLRRQRGDVAGDTRHRRPHAACDRPERR